MISQDKAQRASIESRGAQIPSAAASQAQLQKPSTQVLKEIYQTQH